MRHKIITFSIYTLIAIYSIKRKKYPKVINVLTTIIIHRTIIETITVATYFV